MAMICSVINLHTCCGEYVHCCMMCMSVTFKGCHMHVRLGSIPCSLAATVLMIQESTQQLTRCHAITLPLGHRVFLLHDSCTQPLHFEDLSDTCMCSVSSGASGLQKHWKALVCQSTSTKIQIYMHARSFLLNTRHHDRIIDTHVVHHSCDQVHKA